MKIVLCGMPGSGKTTIGKKLADHLNVEHFDTDKMIENRFKKSCRELYKEGGKAFFRRIESVVVQDALKNRGILSLGGGSLDLIENRELIQNYGTVIYLSCEFKRLVDRKIQNDSPAYSEDFFHLYTNRTPIFESVCHYTIDVSNLSVEESIKAIIQEVCYVQ